MYLRPMNYLLSYQVVKCLINNNADINMSGAVGDRPLHLACAMGYLAITESLVKGRRRQKADGELINFFY